MKAGDYIWHKAGPVGYAFIIKSGHGTVRYKMLMHHSQRAYLVGSNWYSCEEADIHMRIVTEEEVMRALLAGEIVEGEAEV